ncbi:hypothetical protein [Streptomyces mirabilis]|uniref:hypothetical protein n=1 Tax=Streptomyces mirabilis TaxID=68239 RepID=UPI0037F8969F
MIEEHPSDLRADIARYFSGRSLNEFHRNECGTGTMSWLELWEFLLALPHDSMTKAALSGDRARRRWSEHDHMIATSLTLQHELVRALHLLRGVSPHDLPRLFEWAGPDLRSQEQIEADEERWKRQQRHLQKTRPQPPDPELMRRLHEEIERRQQGASDPQAPQPAQPGEVAG